MYPGNSLMPSQMASTAEHGFGFCYLSTLHSKRFLRKVELPHAEPEEWIIIN